MADVTVSALKVVEDTATGLPYLLPEEPLRLAISTHAGYNESCLFISNQRPGWFVKIKRPAHLSEGQIVTSPGDLQLKLRAGVGSDLEVQLTAPAVTAINEATDVLEVVVSSLKSST